MKIMHVITTTGVGGAERMLLKTLKSQVAHADSTYVVSLLPKGALANEIEQYCKRIYFLNLNTALSYFLGVFQYLILTFSVRPHIVQGWMYHGNAFATLSKFILPFRVRCFWNIRQCLYDINLEKPLTRAIIRILARCAFCVEKIVNNSRVSIDQHDRLGIPKKKSLYLPNGFEAKLFSVEPANKIGARNKYGIDLNQILIGHMASFHQRKDQLSLLEAFALFNQHFPASKLIIAGRGFDQSKKFLEKIELLGISDCVILLGEVSDTFEFYSALDLFCLSSVNEGFPNVLVEASLSGIPCVATAIAENNDIIGNPDFLVAVKKPDELAAAMEKVINMPIPELAQYVNQQRLDAVERFSIDAVSSQLYNLYLDN